MKRQGCSLNERRPARGLEQPQQLRPRHRPRRVERARTPALPDEVVDVVIRQRRAWDADIVDRVTSIDICAPDGCLPRFGSLLRHHPHPRHDVHRRSAVPARSGRRQLRRARSVKAALIKGVARQSHALRPDHGHSAAARPARRRRCATKNGIPVGQRRRGDGHVRRHSRRVLGVPGPARAWRRGAGAGSGVAAGAGNVACARAVPVRLSAARVARLAAGRGRDARAS